MAPTTGDAKGEMERRGWADAPPEVLAGNTGYLLVRVGQLAREEFGRALGPSGVKLRHYGALAVLAAEGPSAQRSLGDKLRVDRSTMVSLVDELEGMGLVERRRSREDRRRYELTLTQAGKQALSEVGRVVEGVREALLAPLDTRRRRQLHESISAVLGALSTAPTA